MFPTLLEASSLPCVCALAVANEITLPILNVNFFPGFWSTKFINNKEFPIYDIYQLSSFIKVLSGFINKTTRRPPENLFSRKKDGIENGWKNTESGFMYGITPEHFISFFYWNLSLTLLLILTCNNNPDPHPETSKLVECN